MYNNGYQNGNINPQQYNPNPNYGPQNYAQPNPYNSVPPYYKPISPWGYVGYMILFGLPLIGIIMVIVYACSTENINKRNFARSYLWVLFLTVLIFTIVAIFAALVTFFVQSGNLR